ncbi:hypothetical protein Tco_0282982, partial [Tanacetum coccineum]
MSGCTLWRKNLKEVWFTICHENGIYQDLLNTYESSDDDTNVVNAPREPFVVKQDPGENFLQKPAQINHNCCYEYGDSLDDIFCQRCTCKSCGKGAHYGSLSTANSDFSNRTHATIKPDEILLIFFYFSQSLATKQCNIWFPVNYPPQETSKEILQAQEDLMEAIQAFLKDYARMLLKLVDDLQILKGSRQEKKETTAQSFTPYWNFSMIDDEEARENFMKDICTFLRKFSRISFGVTPKVILIAWERFGKIKDALSDKHYQQEDIQELMSKLLEDVRNIREELSKYINFPSWNRLTFYDNDDDDEYTSIYRKPTAITPDLPIEEPDNSLIMGDEHLNTILSVENIVPIPSEFEGISEDTCDVPVYEDSSTFEALSDHSEILSDSNNVDVILRKKLLNVHRLISNIESLKDKPTPDRVFKSPSSFPIPVVDSDSFFEETDTFLSHLDNSLPEFETFSNHTEETRSGSTTTHANYSLPEYDSFLFKIEPDQGGLTSVVISDNSNDLLLKIPEFESFHFDPSFPRPPPEPSDVEISLVIETDVPEINDFDELNGDEC